MRFRKGGGLICLLFGLGAVSGVGCVETEEGKSATYGVQEQALTEDAGIDTAAVEAEWMGAPVEAQSLDGEAASRVAPESREPFELPPSVGPEAPPPSRKYFVDQCPNDKPLRADWAELEASKQAKERERAESPEEAEAMAALIEELATRKVPAEIVQKQQEYLATVAARQREFDGLPDAERAQSVADLKETMLGGNDEPLQ